MEFFNRFMKGFFGGVFATGKATAVIGGIVITGKKILK